MDHDSPDIGVRIVGPDARIIYKRDQKAHGYYIFNTTSTGIHTYCFSNYVGTMKPKIIMFETRIGESPAQIAEERAKMGNVTDFKLDDMIRELGTVLWSVKSEQEYMAVRFE